MKLAIKSLLFVGVLGLLGAGCTVPLKRTPPPLKDISITYKTMGCYGTCPIYTLEIRADGTGLYKGYEYVDTKGEKTITLSQKNIDSLVAKTRETNFFNLQDKYICDETGDMGRKSIKITMGTLTKEVVYDCDNDHIQALEALIKTATNVDKLVNAGPQDITQKYHRLQKELDSTKGMLRIANQENESRVALSKKRDALWQKIVVNPSREKQQIGIALMANFEDSFYTNEFDQMVIAKKIVSPSKKQTLSIIASAYDHGTYIVPRGFFISDKNGNMIDSYVIDKPWEHFHIDSVEWKNENTISYKLFLASIEPDPHFPEQHEYTVKQAENVTK